REEHPTVAPALALAAHPFGGAPFQVQLHTAKIPLGLYVATAVLDAHAAIGVHGPWGGGTVHGADPLVQILPLEQADGITGRGSPRAGHHPGGHRLVYLGGLWIGGFFFLGMGHRTTKCQKPDTNASHGAQPTVP